MEEVLLQNEDLLFSAAGVRCVIGKVRSARFDRCKVQQLKPEKVLAMCHSVTNLLCEPPKSFQAICHAAGESRVEKKGGVWGTPSHFPYKLRRFIRELGRVVRSRLLQMRAEASTRRRR